MAIRIKIAAEYDQRGIKSAQKALADFGDKVKRTLAVAGAATVAAGVVFTRDAIRVASDLEESVNAVNVAYGQAAESILKIGETSAKAMGVSRGEFNQAAVRFSAFAERVVGSGGDVATFIQDISTRAADFASVFNIEVAEALQVFQSGLSGEAEPLKRFGINLLESEVKAYALRTGLISVGETMTEQQKVQARYGLLMESTSKTAGDFANTSDSLANSQRILKATFTDLQGEIGSALLPVVTDLLNAVADGLLPAMEDLSEWINSPDGKAAVADLGKALVDVVTGAVNLIKFIGENAQVIANLVISMTAFGVAVKVATTAVTLHAAVLQLLAAKTAGATVATTGLTVALRMLPWVAVGVGVASFVQSLSDYANKVYGSKVNTEGLTEAQAKNAKRIESLKQLLGQYQYALENGTEANKDLAREGIARVTAQLEGMGVSAAGTIGEINRFNNIKLDGLRAEIGNTAGELNRFRNIAAGFVPQNAKTTTPTPDPFGGGGGGESAAAKAARERKEAFEKVQKLIKNAQKEVLKAQTDYDKQVEKLRADNTKTVKQIEIDFGNRLADIAKQSRERLTSAFRTAASFSLSDLFQVEDTASVANLVKGLTDKLQASRNLIANAGALNAAGFTQTFIEQVVGAGTETGNQLAKAILESNPETQAQLKKLFLEMEQTTNAGMDTLAQQIYNKQGLATQELKDLYTLTQLELSEALIDQQLGFEEALLDAKNALVDSIQSIKTQLQEDLDEMDGMFGGLGKTIDAFMLKLDELIAKYRELSEAAQLPEAKLPEVPKTPVPAANQPITQKPAGTTNVYIQPKVDRTQSAEQVGRDVAKVVNKYITKGGGLKIGPVAL